MVISVRHYFQKIFFGEEMTGGGRGEIDGVGGVKNDKRMRGVEGGGV